MGHTQPEAGGGGKRKEDKGKEDKRVRRVRWEPGVKEGAKSPGKAGKGVHSPQSGRTWEEKGGGEERERERERI